MDTRQTICQLHGALVDGGSHRSEGNGNCWDPGLQPISWHLLITEAPVFFILHCLVMSAVIYCTDQQTKASFVSSTVINLLIWLDLQIGWCCGGCNAWPLECRLHFGIMALATYLVAIIQRFYWSTVLNTWPNFHVHGVSAYYRCTDLSNISVSRLQSRLGLHRYWDVPFDYQSYLDRANDKTTWGDEKGHLHGDVCMPSLWVLRFVRERILDLWSMK